MIPTIAWNEPIEVWINGAVRPYDNLDRRMACTPQSEWTAEMVARVASDQAVYESQKRAQTAKPR